MVLDIGNVESCYRYPHIVLSCDDEDRTSAYSSVYGRLLVDRAVMDGLLIEESMNAYVPKVMLRMWRWKDTIPIL